MMQLAITRALAIVTVPFRIWFFREYRLMNGGIHVKTMRKHIFVPWENVQAIERDNICFGIFFRIPVIACYLASKQPNGPEREQHKKRLQNYFHRRNEIVLLSYTKERMAKIRAFHRAATKKK